jgi:hypothetical protein
MQTSQQQRKFDKNTKEKNNMVTLHVCFGSEIESAYS